MITVYTKDGTYKFSLFGQVEKNVLSLLKSRKLKTKETLTLGSILETLTLGSICWTVDSPLSFGPTNEIKLYILPTDQVTYDPIS